ncbi:aminoglycoside phosphotransferase family protein [Cytobacillus gottheilii]|uniref:aminoglycoside phosphotransferase family protein n=1 Tax=Cytobacillus gottheilii TaxID=859144 RepID=UPI0009B99A17|nr:aminoglycoside phosphotransferase family protein [Cytobacillus gottheilii]
MNLGDKGKQWLDSLGEVTQLFERKWNIQMGKSLNGGTEAFVAEVSTKGGGEAILKLMMPQIEGNSVFEQEIAALTIAGGDGYVRLLNYDMDHRAVLLEKLGSPLKDVGYSMENQIEIICNTLKKSWGKPIPKDRKLQSSKDIINWFLNFIPEIWAELNSPCSRQLIDKALEFLQSRLLNNSKEKSVLVHGDAHSGNILQDRTESQPSFKLIDPDGLVAEPAYDLGVLMREWLDDLSINPVENGRKRCMLLSEITGLKTQAIWEWGFIQSISTGLFLIKIGQEEMGLQMLKVAKAWSEV